MTQDPHMPHTPSFGTLLRVEARKLLDTRISAVITGLMALLALAFVVGRALTTGPANLFTLAGTAGSAFGILLPVLGILSITGEWGHRTALTTFTLEPRRGRVLVAKCVPVLVATVMACLLAFVVAAPMTAVAAAVQGEEAVWRVGPDVVLGWVVTAVLSSAEGLAMGMLLLNAPAAIVIYLVSPMVLGFVGQLGSAGKAVAEWLDLNATTNALMGSGDLTGVEAARLATSVVAWIGIPMAVGVLRVLRKDMQ
jgi:ABC-2 type transport system permease protein